MKKAISVFLALLILSTHSYGFCGFYVAKADTKLFNETSEVIYVRDGDKSVITMSNDFKGDVKDFAMVVPVPVVLKQKDIKVLEKDIFQKFDDYSGPRLVEYYDTNPCYEPVMYELDMMTKSVNATMVMSLGRADDAEANYSVTIEAEYEVEEYDILILSAKESNGLKRWLTDNKYKIPAGAEEVLDPYIKDGMKFFVVQVNMERLKVASKDDPIRPLQISFESPKFMLPIRLGMANSAGTQDMVMYFLTKNGRVETANYRTAKLPTNRDIPTFVRNDFGKFYKKTFDKAWEKKGHDVVMLEYAWDVSSNTAVKCDPCVGPPPLYADFIEAGVTWFENLDQEQQRWNGSGGDYGSAFFTRLHVRYDRQNFPQDLMFIETPNDENWQARYVLNNPVTGDLSCDEGAAYKDELFKRRVLELKELYQLANWENDKHYEYLNSAPLSYEMNQQKYKDEKNDFMPGAPSFEPPSQIGPFMNMLAAFGVLLLMFYLAFRLSRTREKELTF